MTREQVEAALGGGFHNEGITKDTLGTSLGPISGMRDMVAGTSLARPTVGTEISGQVVGV